MVQESSRLVSGTTPTGADSVSVAGVPAVSTDGFLTRTALVPLLDRDNILDVEVTMAGISQTVGQRRVRLEPYIRQSFEWVDIGQDTSLMYLSRADDSEYFYSLERPGGSRSFTMPSPSARRFQRAASALNQRRISSSSQRMVSLFRSLTS